MCIRDNGKEALQKLRQEKADLVLTDIQMPDMNGHELLSEINNNPEVPKVPVIALSGQPNISPADYLKEGFKGSLLKPYSSDKLLDLIGEVLSVEFQKNGRKKIIPRDPSKKYSLSEIKTFAGEDQEALNAILTAFVQSTENNLSSLEQAFEKQDHEKVASVAHKMLPMFRQLGTQQLVSRLEILEKGKISEIKTIDLQRLKQEVHELLHDLKMEIKV